MRLRGTLQFLAAAFTIYEIIAAVALVLLVVWAANSADDWINRMMDTLPVYWASSSFARDRFVFTLPAEDSVMTFGAVKFSVVDAFRPQSHDLGSSFARAQRYRLIQALNMDAEYRHRHLPPVDVGDGISVLFVPGHRGDATQVRGIAAAVHRAQELSDWQQQGQGRRGNIATVNFFAASFDGESMVHSGRAILSEARFTALATHFLFNQRRENRMKIWLIGHSMGGFVAKLSAVLALSNLSSSYQGGGKNDGHIAGILLLNAPWTVPPLTADVLSLRLWQDVTAAFSCLRDRTANQTCACRKINVISLSGGVLDNLIPVASSVLAPSLSHEWQFFSSTEDLEHVAAPLSHDALLWSGQLVDGVLGPMLARVSALARSQPLGDSGPVLLDPEVRRLLSPLHRPPSMTNGVLTTETRSQTADTGAEDCVEALASPSVGLALQQAALGEEAEVLVVAAELRSQDDFSLSVEGAVQLKLLARGDGAGGTSLRFPVGSHHTVALRPHLRTNGLRQPCMESSSSGAWSLLVWVIHLEGGDPDGVAAWWSREGSQATGSASFAVCRPRAAAGAREPSPLSDIIVGPAAAVAVASPSRRDERKEDTDPFQSLIASAQLFRVESWRDALALRLSAGLPTRISVIIPHISRCPREEGVEEEKEEEKEATPTLGARVVYHRCRGKAVAGLPSGELYAWSPVPPNAGPWKEWPRSFVALTLNDPSLTANGEKTEAHLPLAKTPPQFVSSIPLAGRYWVAMLHGFTLPLAHALALVSIWGLLGILMKNNQKAKKLWFLASIDNKSVWWRPLVNAAVLWHMLRCAITALLSEPCMEGSRPVVDSTGLVETSTYLLSVASGIKLPMFRKTPWALHLQQLQDMSPRSSIPARITQLALFSIGEAAVSGLTAILAVCAAVAAWGLVEAIQICTGAVAKLRFWDIFLTRSRVRSCWTCHFFSIGLTVLGHILGSLILRGGGGKAQWCVACACDFLLLLFRSRCGPSAVAGVLPAAASLTATLLVDAVNSFPLAPGSDDADTSMGSGEQQQHTEMLFLLVTGCNYAVYLIFAAGASRAAFMIGFGCFPEQFRGANEASAFGIVIFLSSVIRCSCRTSCVALLLFQCVHLVSSGPTVPAGLAFLQTAAVVASVITWDAAGGMMHKP